MRNISRWTARNRNIVRTRVRFAAMNGSPSQDTQAPVVLRSMLGSRNLGPGSVKVDRADTMAYQKALKNGSAEPWTVDIVRLVRGQSS